MLDDEELDGYTPTGQEAAHAGVGPNGRSTFTARPFDADGDHTEFAARLSPDESGLEGYLVPFFTLSDRGTFFVPGSLKRSAKENLRYAHHLFQHWPDLTIGKHVAAFEDDKGFRIVVKINEEKALGKEVMSDYRFGQPYAWSIGFDPIGIRTATEADNKRLDRSGQPHLRDAPIEKFTAITEARWWESSTVTWGAITTAGPDVIHSRGLPFAADVDLPAIRSALATGRISPQQRREIDALITAHAAASPDALPTLLAAIRDETLTPEQLVLAQQIVDAWTTRAAAGSTTAPASPEVALTDEDRRAALAFLLGGSGITVEQILCAA